MLFLVAFVEVVIIIFLVEVGCVLLIILFPACGGGFIAGSLFEFKYK